MLVAVLKVAYEENAKENTNARILSEGLDWCQFLLGVQLGLGSFLGPGFAGWGRVSRSLSVDTPGYDKQFIELNKQPLVTHSSTPVSPRWPASHPHGNRPRLRTHLYPQCPIHFLLLTLSLPVTPRVRPLIRISSLVVDSLTRGLLISYLVGISASRLLSAAILAILRPISVLEAPRFIVLAESPTAPAQRLPGRGLNRYIGGIHKSAVY